MIFYVDTSVWGGVEDDEFSEWTIPFFDQVKDGTFKIILSDVVTNELETAPETVHKVLKTIPDNQLVIEYLTSEQIELAGRYIEEGALPKKYEIDAQHIAMATTLKADTLVSWNFKHMVNFFRIRKYNAINLLSGYSTIDIRTPKEIIYGDQD